MKIGFIGIGNMAGAIVRGLIQTNMLPSEDIYASNRSPEKLEAFSKDTDIHSVASNKELIKLCDLVFLGAKPKDIPSLLKDLQPSLEQSKPTLVSMAAGISLEQLEEMSDTSLPIIRVMPNLNSAVGQGMTAVCGNQTATEENIDYVMNLFEAVGESVQIPEEQFSIFLAIAGCSPAFTFIYIDALARAAVRHGMQKDSAVKIAAQAVLGSGKLVRENDQSPMDLADQVASPGGTTIEGVLSLLSGDFYSDITQAVNAAYEKDQALLNKKKQ